MSLCLIVSAIYGQDDLPAFVISVVFTFFSGFIFRIFGLNAENNLSRRDAYLLVAIVWIVFSVFGALPFLISGYINNITDAFFEMMSGFTTTGATIIDDIERVPCGLLFWRSMTQWIGGLGIVFFTIAVLPQIVGGSLKVFSAEATGPIKTKLHPRLSTSAKWIWLFYLLLTLVCAVCYCQAGMGVFDSVNYAMSTTATGGFSTHNASTGFFKSAQIDWVCTFFCFVSGINFTLLYTSVVKMRLGNLWKSMELRFYAALTAVATLFVMLVLIFDSGYEPLKALESSTFQVVSFITTTGLFNDDAGQWPHVTWIVLAMCMFIGACSGSTSGGFKCFRGLMIFKVASNQLKQLLHPNAILPLKIDGHNMSQGQRVTLLSFLSLYVMAFVMGTFLLVFAGIDNTNAMTISLSCLSNVGPTLGVEIGPTMSWSMLPAAVKWLCALLMLVGRLEIFTVLVIFTPSFWKNN